MSKNVEKYCNYVYLEPILILIISAFLNTLTKTLIRKNRINKIKRLLLFINNIINSTLILMLEKSFFKFHNANRGL